MEVVIFDDMSRCTAEEVARMLPQVSAQRREQALRYKHVFGQFCCLKSWLILKDLVNDDAVEPINDANDKWVYNEHGKPFIKGEDERKKEEGPFFSISHCKEGIAVAVDDQPIGIDIESVRSADESLIERTMCEEERRMINDANDARDRMFIRLWTQKEAVVKAVGTGIESFEQLQGIRYQNLGFTVETVEKEKYIYSIAYGELHCIGTQV